MAQRILQAALAAVLISAAFGCSTAAAGRYHVYSCRTPDGEAAPADGWSGTKTGTYTYIKDTCGEPDGALVAALGDQPVRMANTDSAKWEFSAPAGATLAAATLWRAGDADGGAALNAAYQFWFAAPTESKVIDQCVSGLACSGEGSLASPLAPENRIVVPPERLGSHLYAVASCGGQAEFECRAGKGDPTTTQLPFTSTPQT